MRKQLFVCDICGKELLLNERRYEFQAFEQAGDVNFTTIDVCQTDFDLIQSQAKKYSLEIKEV